jgi:hypothetical protein
MRYFFDFNGGDGLLIDDEGLEFDDVGAARKAAIASLPEAAADGLPNGDEHEFAVNVRDEIGRVVFKAKLALSTEWPQT